jgi:hypothetical protein
MTHLTLLLLIAVTRARTVYIGIPVTSVMASLRCGAAFQAYRHQHRALARGHQRGHDPEARPHPLGSFSAQMQRGEGGSAHLS